MKIDTVEAALDYVFLQFENNHAQAREIWAETYNKLAEAADSGLAADIEVARRMLLETISRTQLRAA
ncbi:MULTISPECIES: hypothetical protein [Silvimonas]|uniref:hypothetical protein n=1 Tax=Silvimonas TaxID=300264 RepID=UPI0024B37464|nr:MULTISPECIES: hypothetical protein [Silvimonas]MDR3426193.1 hypothetical protein [Silvimonas sp.]